MSFYTNGSMTVVVESDRPPKVLWGCKEILEITETEAAEISAANAQRLANENEESLVEQQALDLAVAAARDSAGEKLASMGFEGLEIDVLRGLV